jgi:hypothetical protein
LNQLRSPFAQDFKRQSGLNGRFTLSSSQFDPEPTLTLLRCSVFAPEAVPSTSPFLAKPDGQALSALIGVDPRTGRLPQARNEFAVQPASWVIAGELSSSDFYSAGCRFGILPGSRGLENFLNNQ